MLAKYPIMATDIAVRSDSYDGFSININMDVFVRQKKQQAGK